MSYTERNSTSLRKYLFKINLYKFNLISYLESNISYLKKKFVSLLSIERVRHRYGLV
jgi:hypothetical protein